MRRVRHALLCTMVLLPLPASARPLRPRFEPDDMELEKPGVVEVDLQFGFIQSRGPYRVVVPDVDEVDIGTFRNVEIDLDWIRATTRRVSIRTRSPSRPVAPGRRARG